MLGVDLGTSNRAFSQAPAPVGFQSARKKFFDDMRVKGKPAAAAAAMLAAPPRVGLARPQGRGGGAAGGGGRGGAGGASVNGFVPPFVAKALNGAGNGNGNKGEGGEGPLSEKVLAALRVGEQRLPTVL